MDYSKIRSRWWSGTCYHKEQLDAIINSTDIFHYAFILHDKDKKENSDELKKPHYHFLVHFGQAQRGAWFKAFATDDMGIVFVERCTVPENAYNYLIHDTPTCKKQGKHLYDPNERISTIEKFDPKEEEISESDQLFADIIAVLDKGMTRFEFLRRNTKRIHSMRNISGAMDWLNNEYTEPPIKTDPPPKPPPPVKPAQESIFSQSQQNTTPLPKPSTPKKSPRELKPLPGDDPLYDIF